MRSRSSSGSRYGQRAELIRIVAAKKDGDGRVTEAFAEIELKESRGGDWSKPYVFPAISQYPIWPVRQTPQPRGTRIGARAVNLPSGVCLKREQVQYVCDTIRGILARKE